MKIENFSIAEISELRKQYYINRKRDGLTQYLLGTRKETTISCACPLTFMGCDGKIIVIVVYRGSGGSKNAGNQKKWRENRLYADQNQ